MLYFILFLEHNCLNFFYLSRKLYINCGCRSQLKSQMRIIKLVAQSHKQGNVVVQYGGEFYSDDDLKSLALVSSFEALMSVFPPHH